MSESSQGNKGIIMSGHARIEAENVAAGDALITVGASDAGESLRRRGHADVARQLEILIGAVRSAEADLHDPAQVDQDLRTIVDQLRQQSVDRPRLVQRLEHLTRAAGAVTAIAGAVEALKAAVQSLG
jgi:hypothetical protein